MQSIQDIWNKIEELKKEQKDIRAVYKDMLYSSGEYQELKDQMETLKARKKQMEIGVAGEMQEKMRRLDFLKHEVAEQNQLLSDLSLSNLMKGERVEITGANNTAYDPLFSVRFRKRA